MIIVSRIWFWVSFGKQQGQSCQPSANFSSHHSITCWDLPRHLIAMGSVPFLSSCIWCAWDSGCTIRQHHRIQRWHSINAEHKNWPEISLFFTWPPVTALLQCEHNCSSQSMHASCQFSWAHISWANSDQFEALGLLSPFSEFDECHTPLLSFKPVNALSIEACTANLNGSKPSSMDQHAGNTVRSATGCDMAGYLCWTYTPSSGWHLVTVNSELAKFLMYTVYDSVHLCPLAGSSKLKILLLLQLKCLRRKMVREL